MPHVYPQIDWTNIVSGIPTTLGGLGIIVTASHLLGRGDSGDGLAQEITLGSGVSLSGTTLSATGSGGTVTSVALTVPSWLAVAGSPVTSAGTLAVTAATGQTANLVLATPNGSTGAVGLRALVTADMPSLGTAATHAATDFDAAGAASAALVTAEAYTDSAVATKQPLDATLTALAAANWAANSLAIGSGTDTVAQVTYAANTFPARASTGNLVAKSIVDAILDFLATPSSANLAAALTDELGSGKVIFSAGTLDVTSGKTLHVSNTLTFTGTDSSSVDCGTGGTVDYLGTAQTITATKTFDKGATPTAGQMVFRANGLGCLSYLCYAADNVQFGFDEEWTGSANIARDANVARINKNNGQLFIQTCGGNTPGSAVGTFLNPLSIICSSGYVGINSTFSFANLGVVGTSQAFAGQSTHFELTTGTGAQADNKLIMGILDANYAWIQATHPGTAFLDLLLQPSGGNVGVGMVPTAQFQLSTDSAKKPTTNTWTITSDKRTKKNIRPFTDGLDVLKQLAPVQFAHNGLGGTKDGDQGIGLLANDVSSVIPYCVSTSKAKLRKDDADSVDLYDFNSHALQFVLMNAVNDLAAQNAAKNVRIAALEKIVADMPSLLNRLDMLEKKVK